MMMCDKRKELAVQEVQDSGRKRCSVRWAFSLPLQNPGSKGDKACVAALVRTTEPQAFYDGPPGMLGARATYAPWAET